MENISNHITYDEAVYSSTAKRLGIDNIPTKEQLESMRHLAIGIFEPLRKYFNTRIGISSFFRSSTLNKAIKGSKTSQHMKGEAMDIDADIYGVITNKDIFDYIKDNLVFDQLIWEAGTDKNPGWVHVSLSDNSNCREVLRMKIVNNKTIYEPYNTKCNETKGK